MKRILTLVALLVLAQGALAEEPRLIKKGGQAAGRGIEKGAKYPIKGLKKAEGWLEKNLGKGGEKTEKADK